MIEVTFLREGVRAKAEAGALLMDVIRREGLFVETPCNGMGVCKKCTVFVRPGPSGGREAVLVCNYRLAADVAVETATADVNMAAVEKGRSIAVPLDSAWTKRPLPPLLPADKTSPEAAVPFVDRAAGATPDVAVLQRVAALERAQHAGPLFGVFCEDRLTDVLAEERPHSLLGLAVDLGTTGVSLYLLDLETGDVLGKSSFLNPQFPFGGDVLSRVTYCMEDPAHTGKLQRLVAEKLNEHIALLTAGRYDAADIRQVMLAGNTIMQHIALGVDPSLLTRYPYRPIFDRAASAVFAALDIHEGAAVTVLPCISSYIGGDITAGIVSTGFAQLETNALFIDIGTNGEIVLKQDGRLYGTSTAAGPALEGMNISCGCRAVPGAIERVALDETGALRCETIGGQPPVGVCGSGLIDLVAALLDAGRIKPTGNLVNAVDKQLPVAEGVSITQKDVRQIQLAKGAISAGIRMLLAEAGGSYEALDEIYIAGSFGYHLSAESVKRIGMIDPGFAGQVHFVGNSSLEGARLALLNKGILPQMEAIRTGVKAVELSNRNDFQDIFVKELSFP